MLTTQSHKTMNVFKKLGFFSAFIIPILVIVGYKMGGGWNYLTVGFTFIIMPILDYLVGKDPSNPDENTIPKLLEERYYRFITFVWVYVQVGMVIWGAYAFATAHFGFWIAFGFVLSMSQVTGGIGITVAHELGHQKTKIEQIYSQILLMTVCYTHFFIEHNRGHHVHVATPADPATSLKNQTIFQFWLEIR